MSSEDNELVKADESVTVQFALGFMDFLFCVAMPLHPFFKVLQFTALIVLVLEVVNYLQAGTWLDNSTLLSYVAMFPVLYLGLLVFQFRKQKKNLSGTIRISIDQIDVSTIEASQGHTEWKAVSQIVRKANAIAFQVSKRPASFLWIPTRCFSSPDEAEIFYSTAKRFWENLRFSQALESPVENALPETCQRIEGDIRFRELVVYDYYLHRACVFCGVFFLALFVAQLLFLHSSFQDTALLGVFTAFLFCAPLIGAWRKFKSYPELMHAEVIISPKWFISKAGHRGVDYRFVWSNVKKVMIWGSAVMFKMEQGWTVCVPFRCFGSDEKAVEFYQTAQNYWDDARKQIGNQGN